MMPGPRLVCAMVATAAVGCTRSSTERPPGPVVSALFAMAAELGADKDSTAHAWTRLQDIAQRVEKRHRHSHAEVADDINAVVFGELGFEREIASTAARFFSLASVINDRHGTCLGLGALYLAIGERMGVPLDGMLLPGHFFVRTRGPGAHNVELLRRGEAMPDAWYHKKYGPWPAQGSPYARPVSVSELAGIHWFNRGNEARAAGDLPAAERAYLRATNDFPDFAAAHASLGTVRQLRGDLAQADAAYREAARLYPELPGLEGNRLLLKQQLDTASARP